MNKASVVFARWKPSQIVPAVLCGLLALVLGALGAWVLAGSGGGENAAPPVGKTIWSAPSALAFATTTLPEVEADLDVDLGVTGVHLSLLLSHVFQQAPTLPEPPPETAPPETAPPETAPPETGPPQTAPPETAPSETVPPVTAPPAAGWRTALLARANGFAAQTTGGGMGGEARWVTSTADSGSGSLRSALDTPGPAWVCFDRSAFPLDTETTIELSASLRVPSDITIDGRGSQVTIRGKGLELGQYLRYGVRNVIVANIRILGVQGGAVDSVQITEGTDLVWLTNLEVAGTGDGLIDITRGVSVMRVTVDHSHIHDADKAMLWGRSGPRESTDSGAAVGNIRGTLHHNLIERNNTRSPSVTDAYVHAYNNVVADWGKTTPSGSVAMDVYYDGELLAEGNLFSPYDVGDQNWAGGVVTDPDPDAIRAADAPAYAGRLAITDRNNRYLGVSRNYSTDRPEATFALPYQANVEEPSDTAAARWRSEAGWTRVEAPADGSC